MTLIQKGRPVWLFLLIAVVGSNLLLYTTPFGLSLITPEAQGVVLGSLLDLLLVTPILFMLYRQKFSLKTAIVVAAFGCVLLRLIVPAPILAPYASITWVGIGIEVAIILFELYIIVACIRYVPKLRAHMKASTLPTIFAFSEGFERYMNKQPLVHIIASELVMFYYALFSWKKQPYEGITLYKNTSYIAFQLMIIHALIIESIGLHYWLHSKMPLVSWVLLAVNIYGLFFLLADMQVLRLHPMHFKHNQLYVSLGLMQRAVIDCRQIEEIIVGSEHDHKMYKKQTAHFIVREFEEAVPDIVLKMKSPQKVTLMMGFERHYDYIAIKSDDAAALKEAITARM